MTRESQIAPFDRWSLLVPMLLVLAVSGCGDRGMALDSTAQPSAVATNTIGTAMMPPPVNHREVGPTDTPAAVPANTLTVATFRRVTSAAVDALVGLQSLTERNEAVVLGLGPFENRTELPFDGHLFLDSIRADVIRQAGASIYFRDDAVYGDILAERMKRNALPVDGVAGGSFERRARDGADLRDDRATYTFADGREIDGRVAPVDFILTGTAYQLREPDLSRPQFGQNYLQFHFRLVDVRNGVIVWERVYASKLDGVLPPVDPAELGFLGGLVQ
jgi:hypothetical protein